MKFFFRENDREENYGEEGSFRILDAHATIKRISCLQCNVMPTVASPIDEIGMCLNKIVPTDGIVVNYYRFLNVELLLIYMIMA